MEAKKSLPTDPSFSDAEVFVSSILHFVTNNQLFQTICGGVHILDFLTREPDLYSTILPLDWRQWFDIVSVADLLDLLLRENLCLLQSSQTGTWRGRVAPPRSLLQYVRDVRRHTFLRDFNSFDTETERLVLSRTVALGMNVKKKVEVECFSRYVNKLTDHIRREHKHEISHIMDFGAGQSYLGRALASPPFHKRVVALESKAHNIAGARALDSRAGLSPSKKVMRNKKEYRRALTTRENLLVAQTSLSPHGNENMQMTKEYQPAKEERNIDHLETIIESGNLSGPINDLRRKNQHLSFLVVGLHACGNLTHHGLRSLVLNQEIKAVCLVGCCYNLLTERTGPPTFKFPSLRYKNLRLEKASSAFDPHGFPMSERITSMPDYNGQGVSLNITARSMACQAPQNWTGPDCQSFFTRHFYRALLQRILLDLKILRIPKPEEDGVPGASGQPIVIGALRRSAFTSFTAYVRGATAKLKQFASLNEHHIQMLEQLSDDELLGYRAKYAAKEKELSIIWSLMSFSAGVAETLILVDRWQYLREQDAVKACWIETVFESKISPRNFCVVGIKG